SSAMTAPMPKLSMATSLRTCLGSSPLGICGAVRAWWSGPSTKDVVLPESATVISWARPTCPEAVSSHRERVFRGEGLQSCSCHFFSTLSSPVYLPYISAALFVILYLTRWEQWAMVLARVEP